MPHLIADALSPDLPVQASALGILAFIVWWFVKRLDRADNAKDHELTELRVDIATKDTQIDVLRTDVLEQRRLKHNALNELATHKVQHRLIARAARDCTCHAMDRVSVLFDDF